MNVGLFLNAIIQFLIVSFAIFWVIKALTRLRLHQDAAPAGPSLTEVLLGEIWDFLKVRG